MIIIRLLKALPGRIVSGLIDQISFVAVSAIVFSIGDQLVSLPQENNRFEVNTAVGLFSIFLNKDIVFGKSIGKNFIGLRVVSARTGNPASPIQCSLRNLFLLLWPLEAILLIVSPKRRIGDFVAGTMVLEDAALDCKLQWQYVQAIFAVLGSFILIFLLFGFISSLGPYFQQISFDCGNWVIVGKTFVVPMSA